MSTISVLQKLRASYQPKLPTALCGDVKMMVGESTESVADQEQIQELFPNTYGMPQITFVRRQDMKKRDAYEIEAVLKKTGEWELYSGNSSGKSRTLNYGIQRVFVRKEVVYDEEKCG